MQSCQLEIQQSPINKGSPSIRCFHINAELSISHMKAPSNKLATVRNDSVTQSSFGPQRPSKRKMMKSSPYGTKPQSAKPLISSLAKPLKTSPTRQSAMSLIDAAIPTTSLKASTCPSLKASTCLAKSPSEAQSCTPTRSTAPIPKRHTSPTTTKPCPAAVSVSKPAAVPVSKPAVVSVSKPAIKRRHTIDCCEPPLSSSMTYLQKHTLYNVFKLTPRPSRQYVAQLARWTNVSEDRVSAWFSKRRAIKRMETRRNTVQ